MAPVTRTPPRRVRAATRPFRKPTSSAASGTVSNAARVVEGMRSDFGRCYSADLATNPHAEGSVKLTIHVRSDSVKAVPSYHAPGHQGPACTPAR